MSNYTVKMKDPHAADDQPQTFEYEVEASSVQEASEKAKADWTECEVLEVAEDFI